MVYFQKQIEHTPFWYFFVYIDNRKLFDCSMESISVFHVIKGCVDSGVFFGFNYDDN